MQRWMVAVLESKLLAASVRQRRRRVIEAPLARGQKGGNEANASSGSLEKKPVKMMVKIDSV